MTWSKFKVMMVWLVVLPAVQGIVLAGDPIAEAISHSDRPDGDRKRDEVRNPEAVLRFFEVKPGMKVADIFAGGGYYTELLSRVVGNQGMVYMQNNAPWRDYVEKAVSKRLADQRLKNVRPLDTEADKLGLPEEELDRIFFVLGFHDLYWVDPAWPKIDTADFLAQLYRSLKPGGVLAIIDHNATAGSLPSDSQKLHRIDKSFAIKEIQAAGFVMEKENKVLANKQDSFDKTAFDPTVRGKTDRFILWFRKPK